MPLVITRSKNNKYQVKNASTGEIHAKGTTKKKAENQDKIIQLSEFMRIKDKLTYNNKKVM